MPTATLPRCLALCAAAMLCHGAQAQTGRPAHVYTDIGEQACQALPKSDADADAEYADVLCPGVAGYQLQQRIWQGDAAAELSMRAPDGRLHRLAPLAPAPHTGQTSYLGPRAEWRLRRAGGKARPVALIVRNNVVHLESGRLTSFLVVSKISPQGICVTAHVPPAAGANTRAAALADQAATQPCLSADTALAPD